MRHSEVLGHLAFERIDVRPKRSDPIACERFFDEFELFAAHMRRRQVNAWQHRFIYFEQPESRSALPWPARERSMLQVPNPVQQGSDTQEKTKPRRPAGRTSNSRDPSVVTIRDMHSVRQSNATW